MISSAELVIYLNNDEDNLCVSLSETQLKAVIKLLGIELKPNNDLSMFSDDGLKMLMDKTINKYIVKE